MANPQGTALKLAFNALSTIAVPIGAAIAGESRIVAFATKPKTATVTSAPANWVQRSSFEHPSLDFRITWYDLPLSASSQSGTASFVFSAAVSGGAICDRVDGIFDLKQTEASSGAFAGSESTTSSAVSTTVSSSVVYDIVGGEFERTATATAPATLREMVTGTGGASLAVASRLAPTFGSVAGTQIVWADPYGGVPQNPAAWCRLIYKPTDTTDYNEITGDGAYEYPGPPTSAPPPPPPPADGARVTSTAGVVNGSSVAVSIGAVPAQGLGVITLLLLSPTNVAPPSVTTPENWAAWNDNVHSSPVNSRNAASRIVRMGIEGPLSAQTLNIALSGAAVGYWEANVVTNAQLDSSTFSEGPTYVATPSTASATAAQAQSVVLAAMGSNFFRRDAAINAAASSAGYMQLQRQVGASSCGLGTAYRTGASGAVAAVGFVLTDPDTPTANGSEQTLSLLTILKPYGTSGGGVQSTITGVAEIPYVERPKALSLVLSPPSNLQLTWQYTGSGDGFQVVQSTDNGQNWTSVGGALGGALRTATFPMPSVSTRYSVIATRSSDSSMSARATPEASYAVAATPPPPPPPAYTPPPSDYGPDDVPPVDTQRQPLIKRQVGFG